LSALFQNAHLLHNFVLLKIPAADSKKIKIFAVTPSLSSVAFPIASVTKKGIKKVYFVSFD